MGDFIGQLRARQAQINAEIGQHLSALAALSNELSDIAAAGRVFAGIASTKTNSPEGANEPGAGSQPVKVEGSSIRANVSTGVTSGERPAQNSQAKVSTGNDGSNAPLDSAPVSGEAIRPSDGGGTVDHAADTSGSTMSDVSAAMNSLLGETGAASHFQATDKSGAASSDKAAPAPSLAERLRALNAIHPEFTLQQAAAELCETYERVRNNSNVNRIKWGREEIRAVGLQERVAELHMQHRDWSDEEIAAAIGKSNGYVRATAHRLGLVLPSRKRPVTVAQKPVEPVFAPDEPSPTPKPERRPAVKSEPAIDTPRIPRPLSGSKFYLVNDKGEYLNRFCAGFTTDKRTAWIGTEQQLTACRRNFDIARDLTERAVTKELPPAPVNREVA